MVHILSSSKISTNDSESFFIIVEGAVEVHAVLPTKSRKTQNIREFLCKKDVGDMVNMKSMRKLILESNARDLYEREESDNVEHNVHKKNILDIVDTITIISAADSTILQMNWDLFESRFKQSDSKLNVDMLRTVMQTNLSDYLINIPVFDSLPNSKLELLSRLCHYSIEKVGAVICREGDHGDEVFVLLSGEVKVEAMASKRMVELFEEGILSPLEKKTSFSSNDNNQDSDVVSLKSNYAQKTITSSQKSFIRRRQTLVTAGHNCRREKIEKTFSSLDRYKQNSNENEDSSLRRISRLDIPDPNHTVELARFKPGDYFGEISTFIELPRAATVTATTNVLMVSISKTSFRTLYHNISPELETDIEIIVKQHMLQTLLQSKSPFLEVIDSEDAKRMANLSTIQTVKEGQTVFRENDEADDFYFVYSGQLSVTQTAPIETDQKGIETRKEIHIGTLFPGDYFGEMALLNHTERLATIVATSTTVLITITRANFYTCFQETPQLIAEFLVRMKGIHVDLETLLGYSKSRKEFATYLSSVKSHALSCYEEIEAFELSASQDQDMPRAVQVAQIIEKYLIEGASHFVDTKSSCQNTMIISTVPDDLEESNINADFFNDLKVFLKIHLETEMLPKFKDSELFQVLKKRMRTYDDIDVKLLV
jgi:CRP-like cAMP-binding protein